MEVSWGGRIHRMDGSGDSLVKSLSACEECLL